MKIKPADSKKGKPDVSVVIPAYNEGKYLPKLLDSIKAQDFKSIETIVAIKPSKDNTISVAKKYGCRIVLETKPGGVPGIARNLGAKIARADKLLFLDADTIMPARFISRLVAKVEKEKIACASMYFRPISRNPFDTMSFFFLNTFYWLFQKIGPSAPGWGIIIKRSTFRKIGGFDESLHNFEDYDLVKRASKAGKFSFLTHPQLLVSVRRSEKEGRLVYSLKVLWLLVLYGLLGKKGAQHRVKYEFGKF